MTKFLEPNDPNLYKIAKKVPKKNLQEKWFLDIVEEMKVTAGVNQHKNKNTPIMVGLAAPQIGYSLQLVFVDFSAKVTRGKEYVKNIFMVNPEILEYGKQMKRGREGCYSTKIDWCSFNGIVKRAQKVKVKYMTLDGMEKIEDVSGFTAVIIQHEVDHLNGKVFVEHIQKEKDLHIVLEGESSKYKKNFLNWRRIIDPKYYFENIVKISKK